MPKFINKKKDIEKAAESYMKRLARNNAYNKERYKQLNIRLSYADDADIIEWLNNISNNTNYICYLIRKDMELLRYGKKKKSKR